MDLNNYMNSKFHWLIDAGHGGLRPETNEYVTKGKRSPKFPNSSKFSGEVLFEGVKNRRVLESLTKLLSQYKIKYTIISDDWIDLPLTDRVIKANNISENTPNCIYLSIHHNAYKKDWNNANGLETFHYPKSDKGFKIASVFQRNLVEEMEWKDRGIKSANFYVLKYTSMPSILTECGFMTNLKEAEVLMSDEGSEKIAYAHFEAIKEINERGLNFL